MSCHGICGGKCAACNPNFFTGAMDKEDVNLWKKTPIKGISADKTKIDDEPVDLVNEPPHYKLYLPVPGQDNVEIDCIDIIKALGLTKNYWRASAFKYLWRADRKGDKLKDLKKAVRFIQYEIEELESNAKVSEVKSR